MSTAAYTRLAGSRDDKEEDGFVLTKSQDVPRSFYIAWISTGISALFTCIAAFLVVSTSGSTNAAASIQPATLRRVTPYVNPDRLRQAIQAHGTRFEPIQNVAVSTFQMRAGGVSRTLTEDTTRQWQSDLGDVYPEDRHVLVNHSISTILQYRNRDFDMEDCVLSVTVPTSTNDFDPATSLIDGSLVDVWTLADAEELFLHGTSRIASPRRHKMMTVNLARATNSTSSPFQCPSGNFTTLELACSGQDGVCNVDFWQTRAVKTGFVLIQRQSGAGLGI